MLNSIRLRLIPLLVTIALCALGVSLAQWQNRRAVEKEQNAQTMRARGQMSPLNVDAQFTVPSDLAFRRLTLRGQFVSEWPLFLDNRPSHGVAGFYVLMPFRIDGTDQHVLVLRGWHPRNPADRTRLPALMTPQGVISLSGVARTRVERVMQLGPQEVWKPGAILQNLNVNEASKQSGLKTFNFVLEQTSDSADTLRRDWPHPSAGADKHRAYAFQWYALSLMAVIFFVVTGLRRGKHR